MNRLFLFVAVLLMGSGQASLFGQLNITSVPEGSGLAFQFEVVESELAPPLAPVEGLPEPTFWPFIEFGDGYYGFGSPIHTYTEYLSLDEYRVKSVVNPLYSNSEQPPDMERGFDAGGSIGTFPPSLMPFDEVLLDLRASWEGSVRPKDKLTAIMLYEPVNGDFIGSFPFLDTIFSSNIDPSRGNISLLYHSDVISAVDDANSSRRYHKESAAGGRVDYGPTGKYNAHLSWNFENLEEERSIFSDLKVNSVIGEEDSTVHLKVIIEYGRGSFLTDSLSLSIEKVMDPNSLQYSPKSVPKDGGPATLDGYLRFSNIGSGIVNNIRIEMPIHDALDGSLLKILDSDAGTDATFVDVSPPGSEKAIFQATEAGLPGAQTIGLNTLASTHGYLHFQIPTKPEAYGDLPDLFSQANIYFEDMPPVPTNVERVLITSDQAECDDCCKPMAPATRLVLILLLVAMTAMVAFLLFRESNA
ncbi:MAG: hypothetical protein AAF399_11130 [Bacteroidota bacterium]